jgi:XTP/dITP diphosphohydrolase
MKILFATQNQNKIEEVKNMLPSGFELMGLNQFNFTYDIPETQPTIEGNAIQKANFVFNTLKTPCFAEDTGLIVPSLNGEPGVYSARYAGPYRDPLKNMEKLLKKLSSEKSREAYFETVIALKYGHKLETFVGRCKGRIAHEAMGSNGFGYDPIFIPEGYDLSFASLSKSIKNKISHRAIAMSKLIAYLSE